MVQRDVPARDAVQARTRQWFEVHSAWRTLRVSFCMSRKTVSGVHQAAVHAKTRQGITVAGGWKVRRKILRLCKGGISRPVVLPTDRHYTFDQRPASVETQILRLYKFYVSTNVIFPSVVFFLPTDRHYIPLNVLHPCRDAKFCDLKNFASLNVIFPVRSFLPTDRHYIPLKRSIL